MLKCTHGHNCLHKIYKPACSKKTIRSTAQVTSHHLLKTVIGCDGTRDDRCYDWQTREPHKQDNMWAKNEQLWHYYGCTFIYIRQGWCKDFWHPRRNLILPPPLPCPCIWWRWWGGEFCSASPPISSAIACPCTSGSSLKTNSYSSSSLPHASLWSADILTV